MKQRKIDELARLEYEEELLDIRRYKRDLNTLVIPERRRYNLLQMIKYHKKRLGLAKRSLPMKAVLEDDGLFDMYRCPCCRWVLDFLAQHCSECGQRIMW